jgi:nitroreductase
MEFLELSKKRHFKKGFKNVPVEDEKVIRILEAGRLAPSLTDAQPIHFIFIK